MAFEVVACAFDRSLQVQAGIIAEMTLDVAAWLGASYSELPSCAR